MFEYKIVHIFFTTEEQLVKGLNKLGKDGWEMTFINMTTLSNLTGIRTSSDKLAEFLGKRVISPKAEDGQFILSIDTTDPIVKVYSLGKVVDKNLEIILTRKVNVNSTTSIEFYNEIEVLKSIFNPVIMEFNGR
jgi:hypothetical protein